MMNVIVVKLADPLHGDAKPSDKGSSCDVQDSCLLGGHDASRWSEHQLSGQG